MERKGIKIKSAREIGKLVKKRRNELNWSQEALAESLGISYQQVQRYENGTNRINLERLQLISKVLEVPYTYFFEDSNIEVGSQKASYLTEKEDRLIKLFRKIKSNDRKKAVIQMAELIANKKE